MADVRSNTRTTQSSPDKIDEFLDQFTDVSKLEPPAGPDSAQASLARGGGHTSDPVDRSASRFCAEATTPDARQAFNQPVGSHSASSFAPEPELSVSDGAVHNSPAHTDWMGEDRGHGNRSQEDWQPVHVRFATELEDQPAASSIARDADGKVWAYDSLQARLSGTNSRTGSDTGAGVVRTETFRELLDKIRLDAGEIDDPVYYEPQAVAVQTNTTRTNLVVVGPGGNRTASRFNGVRAALAASVVAAAAAGSAVLYWEDVVGEIAPELASAQIAVEDDNARTDEDVFAFIQGDALSFASIAINNDAPAERSPADQKSGSRSADTVALAFRQPDDEPHRFPGAASPPDDGRHLLPDAAGEDGAPLPLRLQPRHGNSAVPTAILISGLPGDAVLSAGTRITDTSWGLLPHQLDDLHIILGPSNPEYVEFSVSVFGTDGGLAGERQMRIERAKVHSERPAGMATAATMATGQPAARSPEVGLPDEPAVTAGRNDASDISTPGDRIIPPPPRPPVLRAETGAQLAPSYPVPAPGPAEDVRSAPQPEPTASGTADRPSYALGKKPSPAQPAQQEKSFWDSIWSFEATPVPDWAKDILQTQ